jgi:hypothetical protein
MDGDLTLFELDGFQRPPGPGFCARPIGRRSAPRVRTRPARSRRPPATERILAQIAQLGSAIANLAGEISAVRRCQRRDSESLYGALRAIVEVKRSLGLTELHRPEAASRRRPLGE